MPFFPSAPFGGGVTTPSEEAGRRAPGDHRLALLFAASLGPGAVQEAGKRWLALPEGERAEWRVRAGVPGGEEYLGLPPLQRSEGVEPPAAGEEGPPSAPGLLRGARRHRRHRRNEQQPAFAAFLSFAQHMRGGASLPGPHEWRQLATGPIGSMWRAMPAQARLEWVLLGQGIE